MRLSQTQRVARRGFTLVELLVVIAIIAVLAGLIISAVIKLLVKGPITANRTEIGQLEFSVKNFQTQFKVPYLPSRLLLCEVYGNYATTVANNPQYAQLAADSIAYLRRLFPAILNPDNNPNSPTAGKIIWKDVGIDWNGNGTIDQNSAWILEGDQCLVFFLGGIPSTAGGNSCTGFSLNQRDPSGGGGSRTVPLYDFKSNRLVDIHGNGFFSYKDYYQINYFAYFSNYGQPNNPAISYAKYSALGSDCGTLGVSPYQDSANPLRYVNPSSFQIISAGADGKFGPGGVWKASQAYSIADVGKDDQANFHGRLLGVAE